MKLAVLAIVTIKVTKWDENGPFQKHRHVACQQIRLAMLYNDQVHKSDSSWQC